MNALFDIHTIPDKGILDIYMYHDLSCFWSLSEHNLYINMIKGNCLYQSSIWSTTIFLDQFKHKLFYAKNILLVFMIILVFYVVCLCSHFEFIFDGHFNRVIFSIRIFHCDVAWVVTLKECLFYFRQLGLVLGIEWLVFYGYVVR